MNRKGIEMKPKYSHGYERTVTFLIIVWGIGAILSLALLGMSVAVAWHFIAKFW